MLAHSATGTRWVSNAATAILAGAIALAIMAADMTQARASDLIVKYDQSQLLRVSGRVADVIIGNPSIADVTIHSANLLVVTGKSFGITNLIAIDAEGKVIQDQRVLVQRDEVTVVNLQKAGKRESYNCSPQCNPMITIGDSPEHFQAIATGSERKMKLSADQAVSGGASSGQ